ncbi:MAG: acyl-CoA thioesterase [Armatimonadetes bacterium]|nr:acyl-CoA thioesterase [Armatimonadota bacterium]
MSEGIESRSVSSTEVQIAEIVEPGDANFLGKMFGGAVLAKIDLCAYAVSSKFAGTIAVTASFDRVDFHEPIEVGELLTLIGHVTFVGRTSMEVTIELYAHNLFSGNRRHTNTARVTMVALKDGKPCPVPRLHCETREERIRYLEGHIRRERRKVYRAALEQEFKTLQTLSDAELDAMIKSSTP